MDHEVTLDGPERGQTGRSSRDSILGESGYLNLRWRVEVSRPESIYDDNYPTDVPMTLANMSVYGSRDEDDHLAPDGLPLDYMYVDHLYVQPEARERGYGQLLWDAYAMLVYAIDGYGTGKIGEDAAGTTTEWLTSKGVPRADIDIIDSGAWLGERSVKWDTTGRNIYGQVPIEEGAST